MLKKQHLIDNAIKIIEENLNNIDVDTVCENFDGSKWEFQRLFSALTADTIGNYIRKRRLTSAAQKIIINPQIRILDVAIEAGFSSQEAFSRAFKLLFTVSPSDIAKQKALFRRYKKNKIEVNQLIHINENLQKEPEIIFFDKPRYFVGISIFINNFFSDEPDYINLAPEIWKKFSIERKKIHNRFPGLSYGFAIDSNGQLTEDKFKYLCSVEVDSIQNYGETQFEHLTIAPGNYAVFKNQGHPYNSKFTINYIYGSWLLRSNYKRALGFDFEVFNQNFGLDKNSISKYYVPVTSKTV